MRRLAYLALLALPAAPAQAQQDRFDLGQRLRLFERALERHADDAKARRRALGHLDKVTAAFFTGQQGKAGELLDLARLALDSDKQPSAAARFAASLAVRPAARLLDATASELPLSVAAFYRTAARPEKMQLRLALARAAGPPLAKATLAVGELPLKAKLMLKEPPEGDHTLRAEVLIDGTALAAFEQTVSVVKKLDDRLPALRKGLGELKDQNTTEAATLARLVGILGDLAAKKPAETNYPAARLLAEAEALLAAVQAGKPFYTKDRPGQFWLTLVSGKARDEVRVQVPPAAKKGQPLPVVVALHGAGGSDNMFFDGYGDGLVAKLAAQRGWIVVAPRSGLLSGADPARVVDALAKLYPVDTKKVMLVGHSMGASQAVAAAGRAPGRFAAVAALGGGGRVTSARGLVEVPFFVGVGDKDFALAGAKALDAALRKAGVKKVTYKVYDDVEHLLIVQLALREVYKFFDAALKGE